MNYNDLIERLSDRTGQSKVKTKEILGDALDVLTEQLTNGKGVSIPELGTFSTKMNDQKKVYNPHYEAYIIVPQKRVVDFTPATGLKEKVKYLEQDNE